MPTVAIDVMPTLVTAAEATLFTVPASTEYDIPVIRFVNNDTEDHTLTIWNKASASAGTNADLEAKTVTIQAQASYEHGPMVLPAGRVVSVKADVASKISARIHGWSIT